MAKTLTFVFGGGGSHGALQVGALYALLEAGFQPDLVVGASIGAVNAAYLSLHGFSRPSLDGLADAWRSVAGLDLFPTNFTFLAVRAMFGRTASDPAQRIRDFLISQGCRPEIRFGDLAQPRLVVVSSDLTTGQAVLHGLAPDENLLDAVLVSSAIPPWTPPVRRHDRILMDGAVVSNLPVEPAIKAGATEIIALSVMDDREFTPLQMEGVDLLDKMITAAAKRQTELEVALAQARGVPVTQLNLLSRDPVNILDFSFTGELIERGYELARRLIGDSGLSDFQI